MTGKSGGLAKAFLFGGEERQFRLDIGAWRRIEAKCNAGPEEIAARLAPTATAVDAGIAVVTAATMGLTGKWRVDDVRSVLFEGLIGGGTDQVLAGELMRDYFMASPMRTNAALAYAIVATSIEGLESSQAGEPEGEGGQVPPSPMAASSGRTSTHAGGARGSRRAKSTK